MLLERTIVICNQFNRVWQCVSVKLWVSTFTMLRRWVGRLLIRKSQSPARCFLQFNTARTVGCSIPRLFSSLTAPAAPPPAAGSQLNSDCAPLSSSLESIEGPSPRDSEQGLYVLRFTCSVCDETSVKKFTKKAYHDGVVIIKCPGCQNLHLVSDQLCWFGEEPTTVVEILEKKGEKVLTSFQEAGLVSLDDVVIGAGSDNTKTNGSDSSSDSSSI